MPFCKHWLLWGRLSPSVGRGHSVVFVGEAVNGTVVVAQLCADSDFEMAAYGPCAAGMVDHLLMVADYLDILRQTPLAVLTDGH